MRKRRCDRTINLEVICTEVRAEMKLMGEISKRLQQMLIHSVINFSVFFLVFQTKAA